MRLADPATCGRASPPVTEAAARCLWNLAISDRNKLRIAQHGGVAALVALARDGATVGAKEAAAGALRNLAVDKANQVAVVAAGAIPPLVELLRDGGSLRCATPRTATSVAAGAECAARCLWNLAFDNAANQAAIVAAGAVEALCDLCGSGGTTPCREGAAGALRNLSYENDDARSRMVACGAVDTLLGMEEVSETASKHAVALLKHVADLDACRPMVAKALHLRWRDATIDIIRATIDAHFREAIVAKSGDL